MSDQTTKARNRLPWVDQTKGLAILAIILFHFFQNYPERINLVASLNRTGARFGYASVDMFFIMAGFNTSYVLASVLRKNYDSWLNIDWKSWLKKRILRLYPTYILAVITSLLLYQAFGRVHVKNWMNFVLSCLGIAGYKFQEINPGFWFFTVILEAYLVTPLIFAIFKKPKNILITGIVVGLLSKIACLAASNNSDLFLFLLQTNFLSSYFFQLCLGLYWGFVYADKQAFRKIDFTIATGVFILGIIVYSLMAIAKINIIYMLGFDMVFTPFLFLVIYLAFENLREKRWLTLGLSFFSLMGVYSYQIYLIHQPLYFSLLRFMTKYIYAHPYLKVLLSLLSILAILGVYVYVFVKVEKFLRGMFEKPMIKQS
jgi:peptidoglycan/LPS O-acetylase OafA/YrhL